ncbi:MAG: hypothetical protein A2X49_05265 [Lentisphaerae bacterium GWF2_52_8]|nr:MAG: hypothetical protein A2X49_05265 [Lentisphaerae bacterium GWF2_52_8]
MRFILTQIIMCCLIAMAAQACADEAKKVLPSSLAGSWYSADRATLEAQLSGFLAKAEIPKIEGDPIALILPHAGYQYSGQTAAYGLKTIEGHSYKRVIVLALSHRYPLAKKASLPDATHFSTPLGEVPLDTEFLEKLRPMPLFSGSSSIHCDEHSAQIEVPLLQMVLKDFKLVPIIVGILDRESRRQMADILRSMVDEKTLVVASSDFTHYGANYDYLPFRDNIPAKLQELDKGAVDCIMNLNADSFRAYIGKTGDTICGVEPISLLLEMLPRDSKPKILDYSSSGQLTNDYSNSVSYYSIVFTGAWSKPGGQFSDNDKKALLSLARKTLEYYLKNERKPEPSELGISITPTMKKVMGAFVTLHKNGELRGCIGEISPRRALYEAVMDHAVNAGVNDWRFTKVSGTELASLDFEISALTPPQPVFSYKDIVIGKHGMTLSKDGRSAVFLPQVAPEQGWNLEQTLSHLALKAGLSSNAWQSGAKFTVFEAIVFGEKEMGMK